jgi:hypothetical protein
LGALSWSAYEVIQTRTLSADNSWAWPDGAIAVLSTLLVVFPAFRGWRKLRSRVRLRAGLGMLAVGAMTIGLVIWAVQAPLPEQRAVAVPPANASPQVVVRSYVAALDEHDASTAEALSGSSWISVGVSDDLGYYIRVRVTQVVHLLSNNDDEFLPKGVTGVDVVVALVGWTRGDGSVGEDGLWGYTLAPIGPHRAWRIINEGMG